MRRPRARRRPRRPGRRRGGRCGRAPSAGRPRRRREKRFCAPVFCSKTISSWPQGIRTRYCVLTPMKLTSVTTPPASTLAPSVGARPAAASTTFSGRTPTQTSPAPSRRDRRASAARDDRVPSHVDHARRRRRCPSTAARDQVGLAEEVGDERRARVLVELRRAAHLLDHAAVHHRDGVGHRHGLLLVVGDVHEGDPDLGLDPLELDLHLPAQLEVEGAERLVEQQHLRPVDQRPGQRDPLLLAAGELRGLARWRTAGARPARASRRPCSSTSLRPACAAARRRRSRRSSGAGTARSSGRPC